MEEGHLLLAGHVRTACHGPEHWMLLPSTATAHVHFYFIHSSLFSPSFPHPWGWRWAQQAAQFKLGPEDYITTMHRAEDSFSFPQGYISAKNTLPVGSRNYLSSIFILRQGLAVFHAV